MKAVSLAPKLTLTTAPKIVFGAGMAPRLGIIEYPLGSARQH